MARVLFFGKLRDIAGQSETEIGRAFASIRELRAALGAENPMLAEALAAPGVRVAIDQQMAIGPDAPISGAKEIAFMSPLSGG